MKMKMNGDKAEACSRLSDNRDGKKIKKGTQK